MPDHSIASQGFAVPSTTLLIPTLVLESRERVAIQFPFLSQLHSGKMAVEGKDVLPLLMLAHAARQTQILPSQPKNMALGALFAGALYHGTRFFSMVGTSLDAEMSLLPWGKATSLLIHAWLPLHPSCSSECV